MSHIQVSKEVCKALKKTSAELEAMTIKAFLELAYYNGFDVRFMDCIASSDKGKLRVTMDMEKRPILHVGPAAGPSPPAIPLTGAR